MMAICYHGNAISICSASPSLSTELKEVPLPSIFPPPPLVPIVLLSANEQERQQADLAALIRQGTGRGRAVIYRNQNS